MKAYRLLYLAEVETDIESACNWYRTQQAGLDRRFALAVADAIEKLWKRPHAYAVRHKDVRIAHPRHFPFNIHFYINEKQQIIVILAVIHGRRHGDIVKKRKPPTI
ncbi:MAG: type II toxin-antitoxin system RelE/ParE family toxin [Chitinophagaceae bacterium]|nr:type II toxin-antitoxin system RelE/ParE family toxin [Chitinophagaceae bacterium]